MKKRIDWRRSQQIGDDSVVMSTLVALHAGQDVDFDQPNNATVLDALRRSATHLGPHASVEKIAEYVRSMDHEQLEGLARNVRGIAHELAFVRAENHDGDSVTAKLFPDTNHPNSDVMLHDSHTGHDWAVQLKATDNPAYPEQAVRAHPEIPVYATDEGADAAHRVHASGISNTELKHDVHHVFGELEGGFHMPWEAVAIATAANVLVRGTLMVFQHAQGQAISAQELRELGKNAAKAAARTAVLVVLGATPLAPAVGIYVAARLGRAALSMLTDEGSANAPAGNVPRGLLLQGSQS